MKNLTLTTLAILSGAAVGIIAAIKKNEADQNKEDIKVLKHWVINHPDTTDSDIDTYGVDINE